MGSYSNEQRRAMLKRGHAMRNPSDPMKPAFPIEDRADLKKAIGLYGNSNIDKAAVKRFILKRARAMGAMDMIPDAWK